MAAAAAADVTTWNAITDTKGNVAEIENATEIETANMKETGNQTEETGTTGADVKHPDQFLLHLQDRPVRHLTTADAIRDT